MYNVTKRWMDFTNLVKINYCFIRYFSKHIHSYKLLFNVNFLIYFMSIVIFFWVPIVQVKNKSLRLRLGSPRDSIPIFLHWKSKKRWVKRKKRSLKDSNEEMTLKNLVSTNWFTHMYMYTHTSLSLLNTYLLHRWRDWSSFSTPSSSSS